MMKTFLSQSLVEDMLRRLNEARAKIPGRQAALESLAEWCKECQALHLSQELLDLVVSTGPRQKCRAIFGVPVIVGKCKWQPLESACYKMKCQFCGSIHHDFGGYDDDDEVYTFINMPPFHDKAENIDGQHRTVKLGVTKAESNVSILDDDGDDEASFHPSWERMADSMAEDTFNFWEAAAGE